MPNWCEGTLRVRGTYANLKNFILNGLVCVNLFGQVQENKFDVEEDEDCLTIKNIKDNLYMKGTRRHFCEERYIDLYRGGSNEDILLLKLHMRAAWCIGADDLLQLCQKFHVDMKIQGFEKGMQFSQIVEIVDSEIVQDEEIEYDDWDWDCPCPELGG
jgi:hypothetical protein